jgi:hypothetical protein
MAIWQDLVEDGFTARYASVRRFVHHLRGSMPPEARVVITTSVGKKPKWTTETGRWSAIHRPASIAAPVSSS